MSRVSWRTTLCALVLLLGAGRAFAQPPCPSGPPCDGPDDGRWQKEESRPSSFPTDRQASESSGRILGRVLDARGRPLAGASIVVKNRDVVPSGVTLESDEDGRFAVLAVRAGTWTVAAEKPGYRGASSTVRVPPTSSARSRVQLTLHAAPSTTSALGGAAVDDLQRALIGANEFYDHQRWDEAIAAYRSILVLVPALSAVHLQIGAAYRRKGDYAAAIATYGNLLRADPNNSKARVGIALANVERGDMAAAERTLEDAAKADGATSEIFYNLAEVKRSKDLAGEALQAYTRAAELDPVWGKPVFALGQLALNQGDRNAAARYFQRVVAVAPASPEAERARAALEALAR